MPPEIHELTQPAYDRLKAEFDDLTTRGRIDIGRKIGLAAELGDLKENGDYHAAKEEKGKMEGRIMRLNQIIENHRIIEAGGTDDIRISSVVSLRYEGDTESEKFLLGSIEERQDEHELISPGSPLGIALLGAKAGDKVTFSAPGGVSIEVEVTGVE